LLTRYGFDGAAVPFVRGNAKAALDRPDDPAARRCVEELLDVLDAGVPVPARAVDRPFLMAVEGVRPVAGRGAVATGRVEGGGVSVGDKVEVLGLGGLAETVVTAVEAFRRPKASAEAGENVGVLLRGVKADAVRRGQVVAAPR